MEEKSIESAAAPKGEQPDLKVVVRSVLQEFMDAEKNRTEPAYKAELLEERRRREQLEQRLNELAAENRRTHQRAEEAERSSAIQGELQRLGVQKVDLAFKAVKDDVYRTSEGSLVARTLDGETSLRDYLRQFVQENPELLPARMSGGSGTASGQRETISHGPSIDLDKIRPGMDPEEMDRVRKEISRIAQQTLGIR
jgi:ATP/maltotriose-dependent transcriptional regulator MalT